jgi:hypothetical protein
VNAYGLAFIEGPMALWLCTVAQYVPVQYTALFLYFAEQRRCYLESIIWLSPLDSGSKYQAGDERNIGLARSRLVWLLALLLAVGCTTSISSFSWTCRRVDFMSSLLPGVFLVLSNQGRATCSERAV